MSSTNKTEYLKLNDWIGSDRPQRIDFVDDNRIIDEAIKLHVSDSGKHLSSDEKAKITTPYVVISYAGTGSASNTVSLNIEPNFVIVFMKDAPPMETDSSGNILVNQCFVAKSNGSVGGAVISGSNVIVYSSDAAANGVKHNMNKLNGQYCIVAFK